MSYMNMSYLELAEAWMHAKKKAGDWYSKQLQIEEAMKQFFDLPEEGQRTKTEGSFRTTLKNGLNVSVADGPMFQQLQLENVLTSAYTKTVVNDSAVKKLRREAAISEVAQNYFNRIAPAFKIAPAKTAVEIVKVAS